MRRLILTSAVVISCALATDARAQSGRHGSFGNNHGDRPRGGGGSSGGGGVHHGDRFGGGFSRFGRGYNSFGFGGLNYYYGPVGPAYYGYGGFGTGYPPYLTYNYVLPAPVIFQTQPVIVGPDPFDNPPIREWLPQQNGGQAAAGQPRQQNPPLFIKPTNLEAKRKSIRYQAQGDEYFTKQAYLQALARYKQAASAAGDRPEPRFRMGLALAAMGHFDQAVDEIKRGLRIGPNWAEEGERLADLYGPDNDIARNGLLLNVAGWVREDIRDPERLFLMGVLLYFNEDTDKAKPFFETASQLAGAPDHVRAFLAPRRIGPPAPRGADAAPPGERPRPPAEEAPNPRAPAGRAGPDPDAPVPMPPDEEPAADAGARGDRLPPVAARKRRAAPDGPRLIAPVPPAGAPHDESR
jgi:hypothetical protein